MKRFPVLALALLVFGGSAVHARQTAFGVDIAGIGLLAVGDHKDAVGPALGVLGGVEFEASPGLAVTFRSGYIAHTERKAYSRELVPFLGGLKVTSYSSPFYAAAEAGRVKIRDVYEGDLSLPDRDTRIKTAWGVGFGSASDRLDLRLSLHFWDASHMSESATIGLSLALLLIGA